LVWFVGLDAQLHIVLTLRPVTFYTFIRFLRFLRFSLLKWYFEGFISVPKPAPKLEHMNGIGFAAIYERII
jgi:hypothetical protein